MAQRFRYDTRVGAYRRVRRWRVIRNAINLGILYGAGTLILAATVYVMLHPTQFAIGCQ